MRTLKLNTVQKQIKEGRIECVTDLKIGHVEIRSYATNQIMTITVI